MTLRDTSDRNQSRKAKRSFLDRLREKIRRKERRLLTESLEQRQLLAGPNLVAIQPNSDQILVDGQVLQTAPNELVFRFDDSAAIDPATIASGISITRAGSTGGFETATAQTDLGTGGASIIEFQASDAGLRGNGIQVNIKFADLGSSSSQPVIAVNSSDRVIDISLNLNEARTTTIRELLTALGSDLSASKLVDVYSVSGSEQNKVATASAEAISFETLGANAAQFTTDFGSNNAVSARFVSKSFGADGVGTRVEVLRSRLDLPEGSLPYVTTSMSTVRVILDSTPGKESSVRDLINAINNDPTASKLIVAQYEYGNADYVLFQTSFSPFSLTGATDEVVQPGYIGLGDSSHEVVFRFKEPLPQDIYQVAIVGRGPSALRNVDGEGFGDGKSFGLNFSLDKAPQVAAVVPMPVRRQSNGTLAPQNNAIDVYFTEAMGESAKNSNLYDLIFTKDTASNLDDHIVHPINVEYDNTQNKATLFFSDALSRFQDPENPAFDLSGTARLRIGSNGQFAPIEAPISLSEQDPGEVFSEALIINGNSFDGSREGTIVLTDLEIKNSSPFELDFPGGNDFPGVRYIRQDDPERLDYAVPLDIWREGADSLSGITTVYYNMPDTWLGDDPQVGRFTEPDLLKQYFSSITEQQKHRIREVISLYSQYLGVQFIETNGAPTESQLADSIYVSIVVGELHGGGFEPGSFVQSEVGGVTVVTRPLDVVGNTFVPVSDPADEMEPTGNSLLVMDFQDFDASTDDQVGGRFFRGALLGIGQLLGYGYADHLAQPVTQSTAFVLAPPLDNEPLYPSPADITNGQYLHRPESNDIDLFRFSLQVDGKVAIQTIAERLPSASALDTSLRLYGKINGDWQEIAANDDYFSNDSLVELELSKGDYIVGVTASGNNTYDPSIRGSGIGGVTEGAYDLRVSFHPTTVSPIVDEQNRSLDGDMDGAEGGDFNYWFLPTDAQNTIYVDSSYNAVRIGQSGSVTNPLNRVSDALALASNQFAATERVQQVRVVGGTYEIGITNLGVPLDGGSLEIPKGVHFVVDAGSRFEMNRSAVIVGSTTDVVDRSLSSLQLLGVPNNPVIFTSAASSPQAGDWGGIKFNAQIDQKDGSRVDHEANGVFLNHIQHSEITYGGGAVSIDGKQQVISAVELGDSRPTVVNSRIAYSADAAIAATPDSFRETRFDETRYQRRGLFTPDYARLGPHIRGNEIQNNSINGLFFRIDTLSGEEPQHLTGNARLDDTDIVHVLTENLLINGGVGGLNQGLNRPSADLIQGLQSSQSTDGKIEVGQYVYRLTWVLESGHESSPSDASSIISVTSDQSSIDLAGLPRVTPQLIDSGVIGRRLYRASVVGQLDGNPIIGDYYQVAELSNSAVSHQDHISAAEAAQEPELYFGEYYHQATGHAESPQEGSNPLGETGEYVYRLTYLTADQNESKPTNPSRPVLVENPADNIRLYDLPVPSQALLDQGFRFGKRLYRAKIDPVTGQLGSFYNVAELGIFDVTASDYMSSQDAENKDRLVFNPQDDDRKVRTADFSAGLTIDPGTIVKINGARIELTFGSRLFAEGTVDRPVIFTSTRDDRHGSGGDFDTVVSGDSSTSRYAADWSGLYIGFGAAASLDHAELIGGGGVSRVPGGFSSFNVIELHQGDLRVVNSRFEDNADGRSLINDPRTILFERVGRTDNASSTIFVRGSQPIIVGNEFVDGNGPAISFDINSFTWQEVIDTGRSTGVLDSQGGIGNSGPLLRDNLFGISRSNSTDPNATAGDPIDRSYAPYDALGQNPLLDANGDPVFATLAGMEVRGGEVATGLVWDDTDIVHIVRDTIEVPNQHIYGGLRLESDARGSLVVKFQNQDLDDPDTLLRRHAAIVVGGNLVTAEEQFVDIANRVGGSLQVVGHPDFPVVLTSLMDDSVGAGYRLDGSSNQDTDNNGFYLDASGQPLTLSNELSSFVKGSWDGITIREAADDSNVTITSENEPKNLGNILVNDTNRLRVNNEIPGNAQFLGELSNQPDLGDNVRRLGFIVEGVIAQKSDLDVYSFIGEAGTQIWLDVDRTHSSLDAIVELIDANGNIRVLSNDSIDESLGYSERIIPSQSTFDKANAFSLQTAFTADQRATNTDAQDGYSTNPKDPGMRLILPGNVGQRFLYHVRVRSSNSLDKDSQILGDAGKVRGGLSAGAYQLQIRLQEQDVNPGTQIRYADVRFAANGIEVYGGPVNSPILADEFEKKLDNDTWQFAQSLGLYETVDDRLGDLEYDRNIGNVPGDPTLQNMILDNPAGPLSSNSLAKSVAGFIEDAADVDWYSFEIKYPKLTRDATVRYLSTVFDLDYADGLARANTSIFVFDSAGNLLFIGSDSNVAEDQVADASSVPELSRGSFGSGDPFIGSAELMEGSYLVAVAHESMVAPQLSQFFDEVSTDPLLRLEPIESVSRVVEDHLWQDNFDTRGLSSTLDVNQVFGTNESPETSTLFNQESIVPFVFDDTLLYVSTEFSLYVINPVTGESYITNASGTAVPVDAPRPSDEPVHDVAFRSNGELFAYNYNHLTDDDDSSLYTRLDAATGFVLEEQDINIDTDPDNGIWIEALTFGSLGGEAAYISADRQDGVFNNLIFEFDPVTGVLNRGNLHNGHTAPFPPDGIHPHSIGLIDTTPTGAPVTTLGLGPAFTIDSNGEYQATFIDGDSFAIKPPAAPEVKFEFDMGYSLQSDPSSLVVDGVTVTVGTKDFQIQAPTVVELTDSLQDGEWLRVTDESGLTVQIEFDRDGAANTSENSSNVETILVSLRDQFGNPLPVGQVTADVVTILNREFDSFTAIQSGNVVIFDADKQPSLEESSPKDTNGINLIGETGIAGNFPNAHVVEVTAQDLINRGSLMRKLAASMREQGVKAVAVGTTLSLPEETTATFEVTPRDGFSGLSVAGSPGGSSPDVKSIKIYPYDTAEQVYDRVQAEIDSAIDSGDLPSLAITAKNQSSKSHSISITGGFFRSLSPNLTGGGIRMNGTVTGLEILNGRLYAITDEGGLYFVTQRELNQTPSFPPNLNLGTQVQTATDLEGLQFSGLRRGPLTVEGGSYRDVLFGTTTDGKIYAFNELGEFESVFSGGRHVIDTGIQGLVGLDFSVNDFNLWHATDERAADAGHGINAINSGVRIDEQGEISLAFNYEDSVFGRNYAIGDSPGFSDRVDISGRNENTYLLSGVARGTLLSEKFSLAGYSSNDLPTLYFNYFSETENVDGLDALRVYVAADDGVEHLLTTSNLSRGVGSNLDEFDDPNSDGTIYDDAFATDVQPTFETSGGWRQVRVPLFAFAGQSNLSLRIEFSTSGSSISNSESVRAANGSAMINKADSLRFSLAENRQNGESQDFVFELAPYYTIPAGDQFVAYYKEHSEPAVLRIDGTEYIIHDGSWDGTLAFGDGVINQVVIDLSRFPDPENPGQFTLVDVASLSSADVSRRISAGINQSLPANLIAENSAKYFTETGFDNEFLYDATELPYAGGNLTYSGSGFLSGNDVDLYRVDNVIAGTDIDVELEPDGLNPMPQIRVFDLNGIEQTAISGNRFRVERGGAYFIGLSDEKVKYSLIKKEEETSGQDLNYKVSISLIQSDLSITPHGNELEIYGGQQVVDASPRTLFDIYSPNPDPTDNVAYIREGIGGYKRLPVSDGSRIQVSRSTLEGAVAGKLQAAIAMRFLGGDDATLDVRGPYLALPGFSILNRGPLVPEAERYNTLTNFKAGLANNAFEGVYVDDFIIGFAERGERATSSTVVSASTNFVRNDLLVRNAISNSGELTDKGSYQLEIRDGSEYASASGLVLSLPAIQRYESSPLVIPIHGKPYGFFDGDVPVSEVIPTIQRPRYQIFDLPTADVVVDPASGLPVTTLLGTGVYHVTLEGSGVTIPLVPLDSGFMPLNVQPVVIGDNTQFRTFNTNDRLSDGYSLVTKAAAEIVDGQQFLIVGETRQLVFEFDVRPAPTEGSPNPRFDGVEVEKDADGKPIAKQRIQLETSDSASVVASKLIDVLNSQSVKDLLGIAAARTTTGLVRGLTDTYPDNKIEVFGNVLIETLSGDAFDITRSGLRGDMNRDRSQQGAIFIENSRVAFSDGSGISIIRDDKHSLLSDDARDEFPIAQVYPQNLIELNTESILPGVVVQNNVIAYSGQEGVYISGIENGGGAITTPIGLDFIVNNTIIGGDVVRGFDLGVEVFQGVVFPSGSISFADSVDFTSLTLGDDADAIYTDALAALGSPDYSLQGIEPLDGDTTLSLGTGGTVVLQFTNNQLTGSDSAEPDLVVFETGANESVKVEISRDGLNYYDVGVASRISPYIDIDAVGFNSGDRFGFVRLTDLPISGDAPTVRFGPAGADIDAVGALTTVPTETYNSSSIGILVEHNAGPTLLNNIIANTTLGIDVAQPSSNPNSDLVELSQIHTVIGGNAFFANTANANGTSDDYLGVNSLLVSNYQPLFVNSADLVFAPLPGVPIIDSSIDSLEGNATLATVRGAFGLPVTPTLTPITDINGQIRVDDPSVATPIGIGANVFKERGAEERTDTTGPRVSLVTPRADDIFDNAGRIVAVSSVYDAFEIQLIDGITPADSSTGVGVEDSILLDDSLIEVRRLPFGQTETELLREGVDFHYGYNSSDNTIRLTPVAGVWQSDSAYTIEFLGDDAGLIKAKLGTQYADGDLIQVSTSLESDSSGSRTTNVIEIDTGIGVSIAPASLNRVINGVAVSNLQGQQIEVFDGVNPTPFVYELTTTNDPNVNEGIVDRGAIPVRVGERATASQIAELLAEQMNLSDLELLAVSDGNRVQLRDAVIKSAEFVLSDSVSILSGQGYRSANVSLSPDLRGAGLLGSSFRLIDGSANQLNFQFVLSEADADAGQIPVVISAVDGPQVILSHMDNAIIQSGVNLSVLVTEGSLEIRGLSEFADPVTSLAYAKPISLNGIPQDDVFKLSNYNLDVELTDIAIASVGGGTVTIFDGVLEQTFQFVTPVAPVPFPGNIAVPVAVNATAREMLLSLKSEVDLSGLQVQMVTANRSFRISGTRYPVSVASVDDSVEVKSFGGIGVTPNFGLQVPATGLELSEGLQDGETFTISRGPISVTFELDFNGDQEVAGTTLVAIQEPSLDSVADAIALAITASSLGIDARNVGGGQVALGGTDTSDVSVDVTNSLVEILGIPGRPNPTPLFIALDASADEVAQSMAGSIDRIPNNGFVTSVSGSKLTIRGEQDDLSMVWSGTSVVTERISDRVGNQTASEDLPLLEIYLGGSLDFGDAPSIQQTLAQDDGPRHFITDGYALWRKGAPSRNDQGVTPDSDARLINQDEDNGIRVIGSPQPGFSTTFEIGVYNPDSRDVCLDLWFDWNSNGIFENGEVERVGTNRENDGAPTELIDSNSPGYWVYTLETQVPADAVLSEIYVRVRLSEQDQLGPTGIALSGEVEDFTIQITSNPYRNPENIYDVNGSGAVTPIDALQIINATGRNEGSISLDSGSLIPPNLPLYPDVNGDGKVSTSDALKVINELGRLFRESNGSGEWIDFSADNSFMPVSSGVMASTPTVLGEWLNHSGFGFSPPLPQENSSTPSKTSVFDDAASVQLDSIVDSLAEDSAAARGQSDSDSLDDWFASL